MFRGKGGSNVRTKSKEVWHCRGKATVDTKRFQDICVYVPTLQTLGYHECLQLLRRRRGCMDLLNLRSIDHQKITLAGMDDVEPFCSVSLPANAPTTRKQGTLTLNVQEGKAATCITAVHFSHVQDCGRPEVCECSAVRDGAVVARLFLDHDCVARYVIV